MLRLTWTENALEDLDWWQQIDTKMLKKIIHLCLEICKSPTKGLGKPEPLNLTYKVIGLGGLTKSIALSIPLMKTKSPLHSVDFIIRNSMNLE